MIKYIKFQIGGYLWKKKIIGKYQIKIKKTEKKIFKTIYSICNFNFSNCYRSFYSYGEEGNKPTNIKENEPVSENENKVEETNTVNEENKVEKVKLGEKIYSIENKDFYFDNEEESEFSGIKLYEYDNTNSEYAEIYYCLKSYGTEEAYSYIFEAKNEDGESLLLNDRANSITERNIIGGEISSVKIDKEKVGSKINITIKEMYEHSARSRTLEREAKATIDLAKDLKEQEKVDFKNSTSSYELEDIKFETYKDDDVRKDSMGIIQKIIKQQLIQ